MTPEMAMIAGGVGGTAFAVGSFACGVAACNGSWRWALAAATLVTLGVIVVVVAATS